MRGTTIELAALTIRLRAQHTDQIPSELGRGVHAWFLESLQQLQPELSATIHDQQGLKPFTVSGLLGVDYRELTQIRRDQHYTLRLTTLHPDLTAIVLNGLLPKWLAEGIRLHDQPFAVEKIITDETADSWTGQTTYADLHQRYTLAQRDLSRRVTFQFASPTAFNKTGSQTLPLPVPELVFGSLFDRWARFSSVEIHPDVKQFVIECVAIAYHRIQTRRVSYDRAARGNVVGFTGDVTYQVNSGDTFWLGQLHTLAAYARFSGVGVRTAMGLGQVRGTAQEFITEPAKG